jgi:hypothetical protein
MMRSVLGRQGSSFAPWDLTSGPVQGAP